MKNVSKITLPLILTIITLGVSIKTTKSQSIEESINWLKGMFEELTLDCAESIKGEFIARNEFMILRTVSDDSDFSDTIYYKNIKDVLINSPRESQIYYTLNIYCDVGCSFHVKSLYSMGLQDELNLISCSDKKENLERIKKAMLHLANLKGAKLAPFKDPKGKTFNKDTF